jgi:hypothetical protein
MKSQPVVYAMPAPPAKNRGALIAVVWLIVFAVAFMIAIQMMDHGAVRYVPPAEVGGMIDPASLAEALDTECPTEDSTSINCHWNGGQNGVGTRLLYVEGHIFPMPE